jgi:predicted small secreted protein
MKNKILLIAALSLVTVSLSACENTLWGAGRDVENAGENMQSTARGE